MRSAGADASADLRAHRQLPLIIMECLWLKSPSHTGPDLQEASKEYAGSMMASSSQEREQPGPLSNEALRCYKEGLIDLLRPGESVFDALRRLGNLQVCPHSPCCHEDC